MPRSKMILKDLENCILDVSKDLKRWEDIADKETNATYDLLFRQYNALKEVLAYVNSYSWLKNEDVIEKFKIIRAAKYNYSLVKKELGLSDDAIKSFMHRSVKKLSENIGENTINLIMSKEDKVSAGLVQFRVNNGTYNQNKLFLSDLTTNLPKGELKPFRLSECEEELRLLYTYSNIGLQLALSDIDIDKLKYVMFILESNSSTYAIEKKNIVTLLLGKNWGIESYLEYLSGLDG